MKNTLIAAAVGLISWAVWSGWGWLAGGAVIEVSAATERAVREVVEERGMTRLAKTHVLTMPAAGRIEEITVKEGDVVAKGSTVARLKSEDMALELRLAKAALARAQAAVQESQDVSLENTSLKQANRYVESMQHTVKASEKRKDSGKARYEFSRDVYQRISNIASGNSTSGGVFTREQLDESQLRMIESDNNYQQDQLVHRALQAMQAATDLLPQMILDYISRKGIQTDKLLRERDQAQAQLEEIELRHRRAVMTSPVTGVVLQRPIQHEQFLPAGTTLLEIGDLGDLEVEADVLSQDMVRIREGQPVEIAGLGGEPLHGKVARKHAAGFTKISSLGVEQQRVRVIVGFDDAERQRALKAGLQVGFRVQVRIVTQEKSHTLAIPRGALFRGPEGDWQVYAVVARRAKLRTVQVGLINDQWAEIVSGLDAGQQVVLSPGADLVDGLRIKPVERP